MTDFTISEIVIPASIDEPGAADFIEMTRVCNEIEAGVFGNYDLAYEPAELLPFWHDDYEPKLLLVARAEGRIVGRAVCETIATAEAPEAWMTVEVLPDFRGRGIGAALFAALVGYAHGQNRQVLQGYFVSPGDDAMPRVTPPTGFGSVSADLPGTRFALGHGFTLEQVERISRLELPVADSELTLHETQAFAAVGSDYRLELWAGRTPEHRTEDIALLRTRMSTDAPSAGLEITEDVWSTERVRHEDDRSEASPRIRLVAAAVHLPSGRLAAFSELSVPPETSRPVSQGDTLVLREHRGHRLGMLVKIGNIRQLQEERPGHPGIITFNAEENRFMLSVNEAVGFTAVGYESAWRRAL